MGNIVTNCIKRYPISFVLIILIGYLSLFTPPKLEPDNIKLSDKWAHILMYLTLELTVWFEYIRSQHTSNHRRALLVVWILPCIYGGMLELVQEFCTTNRNGDWLDVMVNTIGCCIGFIIGWLYFRQRQ